MLALLFSLILIKLSLIFLLSLLYKFFFFLKINLQKDSVSLGDKVTLKDLGTPKRKTSGVYGTFHSPSASSILSSLPRVLEGAEVIIWDGAE